MSCVNNEVGLFCEKCGVINTSEKLCCHYSILEDSQINIVDDEITSEELLISLVETRPPLWDSRLPIQKRSKTLKDDLWREIFKALGGENSVEILQKKWKNLRDAYIRCKGEIDIYAPSGSASKKRKKPWKYYELMSFLLDTVSPRSTSSNISNSPIISPNPETSLPVVKNNSNKGLNVEVQILEALNKLPPPPAFNMEKKINPICLQLSTILEQLPSRKKAKLEIEFLTMAYAALHEED